jgi:glycosyltransferase involved in cell wall biosynthesis
MRVAMISPLYESVPPRFYGGTERVIHNLTRALIAQGADVTVFASGDSQLPPGGQLVPVVDEALRLRRTPVSDPYPYNFRLLQRVAREADTFDILHNHHDYWMLPLSEMTDTPLLTTLHGRLDLPDIPAAFFSYPRAHFVSISESQRGPLALLNWARTIHHGIDTDAFEFHERPGSYLAFLGRISWEKRPDLAIRIAREAGVPLKIAAKIEGRESQDYYDSMIKPHVDGRNVEFLGEIGEREKNEFLGNALGLAFPIDWPEPFGLVMVESLACGTPVLARPKGAVPEILEDPVTGFTNSDVSVLARHVRDLETLDRRACRRWVEERFSLRRMAEDYIHVYQQLSGKIDRARRPAGDRRHLLHSV